MQGWKRVVYTLTVQSPSPTRPWNRKKEEKGKTVEDKKEANSYREI